MITMASGEIIDAVVGDQRGKSQRWAVVFHVLLGALHAAPHCGEATEQVEIQPAR